MTGTLWLAWLPLLIAPLCAAGAGAITWFRFRDVDPREGELQRDFLLAMAALLVVSYFVVGITRVQEVLDRSIKVRREVHALPVLSVLKKRRNDEWQRFDAQIEAALARRAKTDQIVAELRPQYLAVVRQGLPQAHGRAVVGYVQALLPILKQVQAERPQQCVQLVWPKAGGKRVEGMSRLPPEQVAAWEQAIDTVLQERGGLAAREDRVSSEALKAAQLGLAKAMQPQWGELVQRLPTRQVTGQEAPKACAASIELLERVVALPQGLAASLAIEILAR
jgi:hypothetical protein